MSNESTAERYDIIVIGGGKAGKTLAIDLGQRGLRTALIERSPEMIGGTCINLACIPTKSFIASARLAQAIRRAGEYGIRTGECTVEWDQVRTRVAGIVKGMREMNRKNFTTAPNVDFIIGSARFIAPKVIEVPQIGGAVRQLTAEKIFINTGTRPARPGVPGLREAGALDSETIQRLPALPRHLLIVGGSYVALEFAQMFRFLGSKVTVLERGPQLLKNEDADIAEALTAILREDGVEVRLGCATQSVERAGEDVVVLTEENGQQNRVTGSHLLTATGRVPNTEELGLEAAGVQTNERGFIQVNERLETSVSGIWALGDVNGGPQFTHASLDDYRIVRTNAFDGGNRTTSDRLIPFTLFTEPELVRIGLTEKEARTQGLPIRVAKIPAAAIPRSKTTGQTRGMVKAIIHAETQRILGCTILAAEAGEMLGAVQMTMIADLPYTVLRDAALSHPTMVEGFGSLFSKFE